MIHKAFRALVILPCFALAAGAFALQAATVQSEKFEIPFAFQVQNQTLPAGEYQIQQTDGSSVAVLLNTKTHDRAQVIRPAGTRQEGKARLVFVDGESHHYLKQIL
jgi:hypothetical protein